MTSFCIIEPHRSPSYSPDAEIYYSKKYVLNDEDNNNIISCLIRQYRKQLFNSKSILVDEKNYKVIAYIPHCGYPNNLIIAKKINEIQDILIYREFPIDPQALELLELVIMDYLRKVIKINTNEYKIDYDKLVVKYNSVYL